jgi:hypothetical protein
MLCFLEMLPVRRNEHPIFSVSCGNGVIERV